MIVVPGLEPDTSALGVVRLELFTRYRAAAVLVLGLRKIRTKRILVVIAQPGRAFLGIRVDVPHQAHLVPKFRMNLTTT